MSWWVPIPPEAGMEYSLPVPNQLEEESTTYVYPSLVNTSTSLPYLSKMYRGRVRIV